MKRSFIGLTKPKFEYERLDASDFHPREMPSPGKVALFMKGAYEKNDDLAFKAGDFVKTGQKIELLKDSDQYVVSTITGKIASITPHAGDFGESFIKVTIEAFEDEKKDELFESHCREPALEVARNFLSAIPGNPDFASAANPEKPIDTIIINGISDDLMVATPLYFLNSRMDNIKEGIRILTEITKVEQIVLVVSRDAVQNFGSIGAGIAAVGAEYPAGHPVNIMKNVLDKEVPAGKAFEDMGVWFVGVEAVASLGKAFSTGQIPTDKVFTLISKSGDTRLVKAKIGTPVKEIFDAFNFTINEGDRIITGGPMRGSAVYSEDYPVLPDTDAIMVQDKARMPYYSNYPCLNCGECIRICPVKIPVNMLVRFLEAGEYEDAASEYDLYSCIECGLCTFVCVSKMPIAQYISLAKYELSKTDEPEESMEEEDV